jgi:hypothetical protein
MIYVDHSAVAIDKNNIDWKAHEEHVHPHEWLESATDEQHPSPFIESITAEQSAALTGDSASIFEAFA